MYYISSRNLSKLYLSKIWIVLLFLSFIAFYITFKLHKHNETDNKDVRITRTLFYSIYIIGQIYLFINLKPSLLSLLTIIIITGLIIQLMIQILRSYHIIEINRSNMIMIKNIMVICIWVLIGIDIFNIFFMK